MSGETRLTVEDYDLLLRVLNDWISEGFTSDGSALMRDIHELRVRVVDARYQAQQEEAHAPP